MAEYAVERWSQPGDWVLDPFCGFGTTLVVAERLGRNAVGVEVHAQRAAFAASRACNVVHGDCAELAPGAWPAFALLLTSPPYDSGIRPVVWRIGEALQRVFTLQDDVVRINTGDTEAALGYHHSHLLVFRHGHGSA